MTGEVDYLFSYGLEEHFKDPNFRNYITRVMTNLVYFVQEMQKKHSKRKPYHSPVIRTKPIQIVRCDLVN